LQRDDADEISLAESADENMKVLTHVSSSTPRSHRSVVSEIINDTSFKCEDRN